MRVGFGGLVVFFFGGGGGFLLMVLFYCTHQHAHELQILQKDFQQSATVHNACLTGEK